MRRSPLMDNVRFAGDLEDLFVSCWQRAFGGQFVEDA
jgi:hypothetical protein